MTRTDAHQWPGSHFLAAIAPGGKGDTGRRPGHPYQCPGGQHLGHRAPRHGRRLRHRRRARGAVGSGRPRKRARKRLRIRNAL